MGAKQSHNGEWFLGIDLGTSSVKAAALDLEGQPLGFESEAYLSAGGERQWGEQDIQLVFEALCRAVRRLIDSLGLESKHCAAFSIGCALHGVLAVDREMEPLTGLMSWADGRAVRIAETIKQEKDWFAFYQKTGCPPHGMYPLYKILWLREHQKDLFNRARYFLSAKAYLLYRLTGELIVDYSVASGSGYFDIEKHQWITEDFGFFGIEESQLPGLVSPWLQISSLDPDAARKLTLPPTTRLVVGASDAANSNIGAGSVRPGQVTCMIGSSGAIRYIHQDPVIDEKARTWCYCVDEKNYLVGGAINNGGIVLNWLADNLWGYRGAETREAVEVKQIIQLAGESPPGAKGLLFLPFLTGERSPDWNLAARGALMGLGLEHNASDIARAALEGIAFRMKSVLVALIEQGMSMTELRASGGYARSELWSQIVASVLGQTISITPWANTSAVGAGLFALLGTQEGGDIQKSPEYIAVERTIQPDPSLVDFYEDLFQVFAAEKAAVDDYAARMSDS